MKRNKRRSIIDFYAFYPWRKNPPFNGKTVPQPYVSKADISDHQHALTYNEWRLIVNDYLVLLKEYLLGGREFTPPNYMGSFQLRKYKVHRKINWFETNRLGFKKYFDDTDQSMIILKWYREFENSRFKYKFHWKLNLVDDFSQQIYRATVKDMNYIYTILNI